jgi:hypothetical protein
VNAFIDEHRAAHGVEPICSAPQVTPSAYRRHAARVRAPALLPARAQRDARLLPEVQRVFDAKLRVCGAGCGVGSACNSWAAFDAWMSSAFLSTRVPAASATFCCDIAVTALAIKETSM